MPDEANQNPDLNLGQTPGGADRPSDAEEISNLNESRSEMSDKLGELEVQRVEASDELERIRNQSAHQVQSQTGDLEGGDLRETSFGDDGSGLMDLLEEANLSPRHLKFCCGGVLGIAVVALLVYGGFRFVDWLRDRPEKETTVEVEEVQEDDSKNNLIAPDPDLEDDGRPFAEISDALDSTVYAGLLLGENKAVEDPAVDAGEILGEVASEDSLTDSIRLFADLYEALQVDVQDMLDQSTDRRDTLSDYTNQLKYLMNQGGQELEQLRTITENLAQQFTDLEDEKDLFEERFFDQLSNLDAYGASAALDEFIIRGEEVVNLRAQYLAREKLIDYYEIVLTDMDRRITDIELNEEALVKGIQVVDIQGSDIDLIIQESEL